MLYLPSCLLQVKIILPSCTIREIVCTFTFGFQVFNYGVWQGLKGLLCSPLSLYTVVEAIIGENKYPAINYSSTLEPFSMNWSLLQELVVVVVVLQWSFIYYLRLYNNIVSCRWLVQTQPLSNQQQLYLYISLLLGGAVEDMTAILERRHFKIQLSVVVYSKT